MDEEHKISRVRPTFQDIKFYYLEAGLGWKYLLKMFYLYLDLAYYSHHFKKESKRLHKVLKKNKLSMEKYELVLNESLYLDNYLETAQNAINMIKKYYWKPIHYCIIQAYVKEVVCKNGGKFLEFRKRAENME